MTRIAFHGQPGAYGEAAALGYGGESAVAVPCAGFGAVVEEVESGRAALGILPVENSQAGAVHESLELIFLHPRLHLVGEYELKVRHCLLAVPGESLDTLVRVRSHPQALAQCAPFLARHRLQLVTGTDTAGCARDVALMKVKGEGAIASRRAAELYGLEVLAEEISADAHNTTRFRVIARAPHGPMTPGTAVTTVLAFTLAPPVAITQVIVALSSSGLAILNFHRQPSGRGQWEQLFFVELQAFGSDERLSTLLEQLGRSTREVRQLGSFPSAAAPSVPPGRPSFKD